jgi:hypothetical protein
MIHDAAMRSFIQAGRHACMLPSYPDPPIAEKAAARIARCVTGSSRAWKERVRREERQKQRSLQCCNSGCRQYHRRWLESGLVARSSGWRRRLVEASHVAIHDTNPVSPSLALAFQCLDFCSAVENTFR